MLLLRNAIKWSLIGKIASQSFTWIATILVIRLLSPEDYGLYALVIIFIALFELLNEVGLGQAIIQKQDLNPGDIKNIVGLIFLVNLGICGVLFSMAPLIALLLDDSRLSTMIQIVSLQFVVGSLAIAPRALMIRDLNYKPKELIMLTKNIVGSILTLTLAYHSFGAWALLWGNFLAIIVMTAGFLIFSPQQFGIGFDFSRVKPYLKFGYKIVVQRLIWWAYTRADYFFIKTNLTLAAVGVFSSAKSLVAIPQEKLGSIINELTLASFSKTKDDKDLTKSNLTKLLSIALMISAPVYFGVSSVAEPFVHLVLGSRWSAVALPMAIIALAYPLRLSNQIISEALNAIGAPDRQIKNLCITSVIMIGSLWVSVAWGLLGVSIGVTVGYFVAFSIINYFSGQHTGVTNRMYFRILAGPGVSALLMWVTVRTVIFVLDVHVALELIIAVVVGSFVYVLTLYAISREQVTGNYLVLKSFYKKN